MDWALLASATNGDSDGGERREGCADAGHDVREGDTRGRSRPRRHKIETDLHK